MHPDHDDPLLAALGRMSRYDVDPARAEKIRRLAHATLRRRPVPSGWRHRLGRAYTLVLEPAVVCGATAVCMTWALTSAAAILLHP